MRKEEGWAWGQSSHPVKNTPTTETPTRIQDISTSEREGSSLGGFMKPGGESQGSLEATRRITPLLTKVTSIGTWNVRTMFETGKTCQVAAEMRSYGLDLLWCPAPQGSAFILKLFQFWPANQSKSVISATSFISAKIYSKF